MGIVLEDIKQMIENDGEESKALMLKYVELGRKLEREELVRDMRRDFMKVLSEVDAAALEVESFEKAQVAELEKLSADGPIKKEMIEKFVSLLAEVDQKHTAIIRDQRNPKFKAIFENYLPSLAEETKA